MAKRKPTRGSWQPGKSGNPGGRPKEYREVVRLAREHTEDSILTLGRILRSRKAGALARIRAAEALLDRGWGRAPQKLTVEGGDPTKPICTKDASRPLPDLEHARAVFARLAARGAMAHLTGATDATPTPTPPPAPAGGNGNGHGGNGNGNGHGNGNGAAH